MKRNCESKAVDVIGLARTANKAYLELQAKYEGKTISTLGALLINVIKTSYNDRTQTIKEHISDFDKKWSFMRSTLGGGILDDLKEFSKILVDLSKNDQVKGIFLLATLPAYYNSLVENIQLKSGLTYGDITTHLKTYVPGRQKGRRKNTEDGTKENPVVLKGKEAKPDNGKCCDYCIGKGWKGLNHTESECFTKKREKKKAKKARAEEEENSDTEEPTIKMIRIEKTAAAREGYFEFDTASTHYTTNNLDLLTDIQNNLNIKITGHDHSTSICDTMGTLLIKHNGVNMKLEKCLYKPTYSNIISRLRILQNYDQKTRGSESIITSGGKVLYKIKRQEDGLWIKAEAYDGKARINSVKRKELAINLHERYGHVSYDTLRTLPEFPKNWKEKIRCEACEKGKATKPPSPKQLPQNRATKLLERIHVDLIGPMDTSTPGKQHKYLMMIVEDYSRYMLTHAIPTKKDAGDALIVIINKLEKAVSSAHERPIHLSQIQADWGGEFRNSKLITELNQRGITLKETVLRHSETNAIIERANRNILEMSRTGLIAAGLPKGLWDKASNSAAYTKN